MRKEITCVICSTREKTRRLFRKPKSWIKYKAPDGIILHFDSQKCLQKFVFPVTLGELEIKKRWKRLKTAFVTLLAITTVWTATLYLLSWYLSVQQYAGYLIPPGITIFAAWIVTARSYRKLRKRRKEVKT